MEDRKWCPAQCTSGFGRGKRPLSVAVGFFGTIVWLVTTTNEPPLDGAGFPSHANDAATCALPGLLFSSAVLAISDRFRDDQSHTNRRDHQKRKSVLGINVGNLFKMVPAAARALGDGIKNFLWDPSKPKATAAASDDLRWPGVPAGREDDERPYAHDSSYLRKTGHRKTPVKEGIRGQAGELAGSSRIVESKPPATGHSVAVIPLPSLGAYPSVFPGHEQPLSQVALNQPLHIGGPSWLFLEGGQLRGVPYAHGDQQRAYYLADEGVWTVGPSAQEQLTRGQDESRRILTTPQNDSLESWLTRSQSSSTINLEGVPESLKLLMVFPEEEVLFVDKVAARAIAKAAGAIASSVVNYPSEKSRALAKKFPLNQYFHVIPRKGTTLFDRFGMIPGRFLGEGSFGIVFEGKSSSGASFAVKVCVQTLWAPMTPAQETKLLSECEASEIRIPELFPRTVDPPALFTRYRMVVPLLTGHLAHLPSVYPLGKNVYGTKVCAIYPSAMCDLQQLISSVGLPPTVQMELTRNMVTVVARLHLLGIVHLDIKLANFLVDHEGRVLLSDFGLAMKKQKTQVMVSCRSGSPAFMSPEMIRCLARNKNDADGKIPLSSKMDAFSLGVALYLIWCGVLPYSAATKGTTVNSLIESLDKAYTEGDRLSFQTCPGGELPDSEIKAIITELLRVDPELRATPLDVVRASTIFLRRP